MRLLFAGTPEPAVPSLRRLIDSPNHEVVAVLTRPDAVAGRGRRVTRSPVGALADEAGIPVLTPAKPSEPDFLDRLRELAPDCAPVVAYGGLIPTAALDIPRFGWVNLHFSLLPAWRGAAPVQAAINAGDEITGATTFRLEKGLDTGPVYGVMTERIREHDTAGELLARLADSGAKLLESTLDGLASEALQAVPQPDNGISHAPKVTVDSARVVWHRPAAAVDRHIRAVTPAPGAWTTVSDNRIKVGAVEIEPGLALAPGAFEVRKDGVFVGTATDAIRLKSVQPQGKRMMPALDWARGARLGEGVVAK
ncbi:methionyl-tRNA formyltransferase [Aldersonia sp. NBC_00410]|uniref:methionyl-tRNA formyltransferase n=1 Tax=Aldersonia sp. NBC_00410 TaxID=2975954 RepID=UPI0022539CEA|nr:methionyl-tRNA formyltransferase [Aldersonia sp. NBC_00410]MCX5045221.1 methionyl-tRNA formyltransferase [Aldersonia sp. NBC_00410]